jgi:hypothetical protein
MTEIDREHFCSCSKECCGRKGILSAHESSFLACATKPCIHYHRKWPTPKQFEKEYGYRAERMPEPIGCWHRKTASFNSGKYAGEWGDWKLKLLHTDLLDNTMYVAGQKWQVVIACTPYGKPPADWRPGE